jgi:hypothetical protein
MLWTNKGYNNSVIFSLFAKSSARSKGILSKGQLRNMLHIPPPYSPNSFQMHGPNFDDVSHFFTLEDAVPSASGHSCNI